VRSECSSPGRAAGTISPSASSAAPVRWYVRGPVPAISCRCTRPAAGVVTWSQRPSSLVRRHGPR